MNIHKAKKRCRAVSEKIDLRKVGLVGVIAFMLALMQVSGWQRSMKYGTSVHSGLFQKIGILEGWQCVLAGGLAWAVYGILLYAAFSFLESRSIRVGNCSGEEPRHLWLVCSGLLLVIYAVYLIGCYPGFYNYDGGAQLVQVMYAEVPYNTHHPLLHTLIVGGIITLGYHLYSADLTFGVFLYCFFQICVCAVGFGYSVRFVCRYARTKILAVLTFVFYAICPPIVMFSISTTKDTLCGVALLAAVLKLYEIYRMNREKPVIPKREWIAAAVLLTLSCLLRNNIVYAVMAMAVLSAVFKKRAVKRQWCLFVSVIVLYGMINGGLMKALDATPGSVTEALSVPFQQFARLYVEKGESAFSREEQELLYAAIEPSMLETYDPMIADSIKYAFWRHLGALTENKWEYLSFWARKGIQYPRIYLDSFLDNTYQAWYPGTLLKDKKGYRYFDITDWQEEYGTPYFPWLYDFYRSIYLDASYRRYPVIRLFFSIGAMLWAALITWFYGLWKKDGTICWTLLLVLLVCFTFFGGPVSDLRYYLILFYLFPVCLAFLLSPSCTPDERIGTETQDDGKMDKNKNL